MELEINWYVTPLNYEGAGIGPEIGITLCVDFDFDSGDITLLTVADAASCRSLRDPASNLAGTVTPYERFAWAAARYDVMHDNELRSRIARQAEEARYDSQFEAPVYEAAS